MWAKTSLKCSFISVLNLSKRQIVICIVLEELTHGKNTRIIKLTTQTDLFINEECLTVFDMIKSIFLYLTNKTISAKSIHGKA